MAQIVSNEWSWSRFRDLLICPVCYNVPMGPIKTCVQGHHTCIMCRKKLDRCPMCKSTLAETRNYVMEEIVANLQNIKISMTKNDPTFCESSDADDADRAKKNKKNRSLVAPPQSRGLFPCRFVGCGEKLPVPRMLNHIRYYHSDGLHEGKLNDDSDMYVQMWEIDYRTCERINAIKVEKMGVFFLAVDISHDKDVTMFVQMVASHTHAQQFMYTIRLSGEYENIYHVEKVISCREPFAQVVSRKRCLTLLAETMRNICVVDASFKCHISIWYVGSSTGDTPPGVGVEI